MVRRCYCKLVQLPLAPSSIVTSLYYPVINWELPISDWQSPSLSSVLRVNNHIFKQTTMAIIILVIFGKTVNFQCFATLEPGVRFHFPKWQTKWQTILAILCNTMQYHEMPSIPNPRNTIDYHWVTLNTKGGGQHWSGPALLFIWTCPDSLGFAKTGRRPLRCMNQGTWWP